MQTEAYNKLFVLPTDECNLSCTFCQYSERRVRPKQADPFHDAQSMQLDLSRGYATESLQKLSNGTNIIGFSGGGEPLLNMECVLSAIKESSEKRFIIATNASFEPSILFRKISMIDSACSASSSIAIFRLSLDPFHAEKSPYDNLQVLLEWFSNAKWNKCHHLFFRSNIIHEQYVVSRFEEICGRLGWSLAWEKVNELTKTAIINGKGFRVIYRPVIDPGKVGIRDVYSVHEYVNLMLKIDGAETYFGTPRGCQGCHGCHGTGFTACGVLNGLDVTIDTDGSVYVYGAEISPLANIYDEVVSYELIQERLESDLAYQVLRSRPMSEVIAHLCSQPSFRKRVEEVNYPHAVIRALNKMDSTALRRSLLELGV